MPYKQQMVRFINGGHSAPPLPFFELEYCLLQASPKPSSFLLDFPPPSRLEIPLLVQLHFKDLITPVDTFRPRFLSVFLPLRLTPPL